MSEKVLTTEDHFELEKNPLVDPTHTIRKFLKDGDAVKMAATCAGASTAVEAFVPPPNQAE